MSNTIFSSGIDYPRPHLLMRDEIYSVLILCIDNSSRCIMAEALFNVLGEGRFRAYSAGSYPTGKVNPFAAERCASIGCDTSALCSKRWNESREASVFPARRRAVRPVVDQGAARDARAAVRVPAGRRSPASRS